MSNKVAYHRSRRGSLNRSSTTVRLALHSMSFDGVVKWVKAFHELEELCEKVEGTEKLEAIKLKFLALEKLFQHVYPKIKETDLLVNDIIEMEQAENEPQKPPSEQTTEELLKLTEKL